MKKPSAVVLSFFILVFGAAPCWAAEKADHVCFRALDSDQDGIVTLQEFENVYGRDEAKFKAADADGNGKLTHDEYHDLLGHGSSD